MQVIKSIKVKEVKTFLTSTGRDQTIALGEILTSIFEKQNKENLSIFLRKKCLKGVQKVQKLANL